MPNYLVTEQELNAVADAIKAKNDTSGKLRWPTEMVSAIQNITTGVNTSDATVTANDLLSGVIAYGSDGTSITGSIPIRQSTDTTLLPLYYTPKNFNTIGAAQITFSSGYYGGEHYPVLRLGDYTITPSTSAQTITVFGPSATYTSFPRAITIEAMSVTDWSAGGSININENKVLEGTYFYNNTGSLTSGSISIYSSGAINTLPTDFDSRGQFNNATKVFESGFYSRGHYYQLTSSTSSIITITPSATSQTITLLGSSATYNYFPYAITIESAITDWTGNGSINIEPDKVLSNTYFYNSTGSLTSGNIPIIWSLGNTRLSLISPKDFNNNGSIIDSKLYSRGYYNGSHAYHLTSSASSIITITPSASSQTITLFGLSATYDYFPYAITIESIPTLSTQIKTLYPYSILSTGGPANTTYYFSSSYYYTKSHYMKLNTTSIPWTITPSTTSQTIYLFGDSYSTQTNKPSGFSNQAFPQSIIIESVPTKTNTTLTLYPYQIASTGEPRFNSQKFSSSYYYTSSHYNKISTTITPWTITPSSTSQTFYLFSESYSTQINKPSGFSNNAFPRSIIIEATSNSNLKDMIENTITSISDSTITTIKKMAFYDCSSLTTINCINCTSIGTSAFYDCINLTSTEFPNCSYIGSQAFYNCTNLTSAESPSCSYIGSQAFYNCTNLTSAAFPNCSYIEDETFYGCTNLNIINFSNCDYIGSNAFYSCFSLATADFPNCSLIDECAFAYCGQLSTANFPICTLIKADAFYGCTNLTEAIFSNCTSIHGCAFEDCSSLSFVYFPKCLSISGKAFKNTNLQNIDNTTFNKAIYIGVNAFENCNNLSSAYFPSASTVTAYAFLNCTKLKFISLPQCSWMATEAFKNCILLSEINLPKLRQLHGSNTFYSCYNLKTVDLSICSAISSYSMFYQCYNLLSIYLRSTSTVVLTRSDCFNETPITGYWDSSYYTGPTNQYGSIYVPSSLVNAYKKSTNWTYISNRITSIPS